MKWTKRIAVTFFLALFICLLMTGIASAAKYTPKGPLPVPRVAQANGEPGSDCHFASVASIIAYKLGSYTYKDLSRSYSGAGDYYWGNDPCYTAVKEACNNTWVLYYDDIYPVLMEHISDTNVATLLSVAYTQLSKGVPVAFYVDGNNAHASVIIGYRGNSDTLSEKDFTVMEIKNIWKNSKSIFDSTAKNPSGYRDIYDNNSRQYTTCYVTLDTWLNDHGRSIRNIFYTAGGEIHREDHFSGIYVKDLTETNAVLQAKIPLQNLADCGFYFGTDVNNLTWKNDNQAYSNVEYIFFTLNKNSFTLSPGTTYYYKLWYKTASGVTYTSKAYSFKTPGKGTAETIVDTVTTSVQLMTDSIMSAISENQYFEKIEVTNLTETNAQINATIPKQVIQDCGFYFGTDPKNLQEKHESINATTILIYYGLNKWGYQLRPGTTYYYKFWYTDSSGQRRTCNRLYSFTTPGDLSEGVSKAAADAGAKVAEYVKDFLKTKINASATEIDNEGNFEVTLGITGNPGVAEMILTSDYQSKGITLISAETVGIAKDAKVETGNGIDLKSTGNLTGNGEVLRLKFKSENKTPVDLSFDLQEGKKIDDAVVQASGATVSVAAKPLATIATAPTANNRNYDRTEKPLLNSEGVAQGGTIQYAIGTDATEIPTSGWTTSIPTALEAGTYWVWYKAAGDEDHLDSNPVPVSVTIQKQEISFTVTFRVVNGSWNDGTTADKSVTLSGIEGETLKLALPQIPVAGGNPKIGYTAGSWNPIPSTDTAITNDVTYTYTYKEGELILGDINDDGTVDGRDPVRLMKYLAGETDPETGLVYAINEKAADLNGDDEINELDLLWLMKMTAGA